MKYLGTIFFIIALIWTWQITHRVDAIPYETHSNLQFELRKLIETKIATKWPHAEEIAVDRIWTEPRGEKFILAHIAYSFQESGLKGKNNFHATIELEKKAPPQEDGEVKDPANPKSEYWQITKFISNSQTLVFDEGVIIRAGEEPQMENSKQVDETTSLTNPNSNLNQNTGASEVSGEKSSPGSSGSNPFGSDGTSNDDSGNKTDKKEN